jgi:hypothetical protein
MTSCSSVKYFLQAIKQKKQCADGNFFEEKDWLAIIANRLRYSGAAWHSW